MERGDELQPADIIAPWYRALTAMPETGRSCLLEVGGANAALFHAGLADLDVEEDIQAMHLGVVVLLVCKAGEDSARQTLREAARLQTTIPSAKVVLVRNEVAGCPLIAAEHLDERLRREFMALHKRLPSIRMPRVRARSMTLYERLHVTPDTVVSWHADQYAEAIRRTGRPRDEAKIFVKDIAAWSGVVQDELLRVLPGLDGGTDG